MAIPFFRGSSWPRDQTQVSCMVGRFFTIWATREAPPTPWDMATSLMSSSSIYSLYPSPHLDILLYLPGSGAREEWVQTRNLEIKISFSIYRFSCLRLIFLPLLFLSMKKGYHLIDLLWNKALLISGLIKNIYWVTIICKTLFWKLAMNKTNQDLQLPKVCHLMIDRDHNG